MRRYVHAPTPTLLGLAAAAALFPTPAAAAALFPAPAAAAALFPAPLTAAAAPAPAAAQFPAPPAVAFGAPAAPAVAYRAPAASAVVYRASAASAVAYRAPAPPAVAFGVPDAPAVAFRAPAPPAVAYRAPAALAATLPAPVTPTPVARVGDPCAPTGRTFPLTTRIHGGPAVYEAGGGYSTWYVDLTNTTRHTCAEIHPVVVLVDDRHVLKPSQPRLDFYEGPHTRPVRFESTDEDELVGAFGGAGFTVGPGKTLTVKVRLALTPDAVPNQVTVNAALVQLHGDDGDWVGQSNDYRFGIDTDPNPTPSSNPSQSPPPDAATPEGLPFTDAVEELASTGPGVAAAALATLSLLLVTVGAILRARGRR
ncbi:hypothetical protein [Streptomyces canus]|uniref:hypothetical protein n=1 Tax=Streptomyces canus TaxID=58343 RepID=UPI003869D85F